MSDAAAGALPQPDPALFNPNNEVKSSFVKWGKVGDWFEGTLHDVRQVDSTLPGQEGQKQNIYEFFVRAGCFHDRIVEKLANGEEKISYRQTVLKKGELWSVGGNKTIDGQMRRIVIGQIFGIRFTELKPSKSKGFADQKVRKVYPGAMDKDYTGATTGAEPQVRVEDIPM